MLGLKWDRFYFAYAVDFTLTDIRKQSKGTHELTLAVKFGESARRYRGSTRIEITVITIYVKGIVIKITGTLSLLFLSLIEGYSQDGPGIPRGSCFITSRICLIFLMTLFRTIMSFCPMVPGDGRIPGTAGRSAHCVKQ